MSEIGNKFVRDCCMFRKFNRINHSGLSRHMMQALRLVSGYRLEYLRLDGMEKSV